jgi:hypothetical protein
MLKPTDPMLISDNCVNCPPGHTFACHDFYRPQPWPCVIAGCECKEFTPPDRCEKPAQKEKL